MLQLPTTIQRKVDEYQFSLPSTTLLKNRNSARPTRTQNFNGWFNENVDYDANFLEAYYLNMPDHLKQEWELSPLNPHQHDRHGYLQEIRQEYKISNAGEIKFASYADRQTVLLTPLEKKMRQLCAAYRHDCPFRYKWLLRLFLMNARITKFQQGLAGGVNEEELLKKYRVEYAGNGPLQEAAGKLVILERKLLEKGGVLKSEGLRQEVSDSCAGLESEFAAILGSCLGCSEDGTWVRFSRHDDIYIIFAKDVIFVINSEDNGISACENFPIDCGQRISRVRRDHLGPYRDSIALRILSVGYVIGAIAVSLYLTFDGKTGDDTLFEKLKTATEILGFLLVTVFGMIKLFSDDEKVIRTYLTGKIRFRNVTNYAEFLFKKGRRSLPRLAMSTHWDSNISMENACYMRSVCDGVLLGEPLQDDLLEQAGYYRLCMYVIDSHSGEWFLCESRAGMGAHLKRNMKRSAEDITFIHNPATGESGLRSFRWLAGNRNLAICEDNHMK